MSNYRIERWNKPHQPNRAMLWYILEAEGYRVYQWSDRPNMHFARMQNQEDQSFWIVSGEMERTINNVGTFILKAGDRDFLSAGIWHWGRVVSPEPVLYMVGKKIKIAEALDEMTEIIAKQTVKTGTTLEIAKDKKIRKPREKKIKSEKPARTKKK